jgi:serine/threonine protein phosphatase PrpC
MGDAVAASVGVSQDPEITEFTFTTEDRILVVGSDGLWEFISNQEIIDMLVPYYEKSDLEGACEELLTCSHNKWVQNCTVIDDITFIIIFMNY